MIKNILLDLDETIFDFHRSEAEAISKTMEQLGVTPSAFLVQRYREINDSMWKRLEKGELTRQELLTLRFSVLFEELGISADPLSAWELYEVNLSSGHYFLEDAPEMLEYLHKKYRLYLVSNGTASVQKGRLESSGIEKYFEKIFISQQIGYNKPDLRYFEKVFENIEDFKKEETVIIGDSLTSDIQGGINAGIKTVWLSRAGKTSPLPDMTVSSLREIIINF